MAKKKILIPDKSGRERKIQFIGTFITTDAAGECEDGFLSFPVDDVVMEGLFDIRIDGSPGLKHIRLLYENESLDLYDKKGVYAIPLQAILEIRGWHDKKVGRDEARQDLRNALGITDVPCD